MSVVFEFSNHSQTNGSRIFMPRVCDATSDSNHKTLLIIYTIINSNNSYDLNYIVTIMKFNKITSN